jgi:hypothetical protein
MQPPFLCCLIRLYMRPPRFGGCLIRLYMQPRFRACLIRLYMRPLVSGGTLKGLITRENSIILAGPENAEIFSTVLLMTSTCLCIARAKPQLLDLITFYLLSFFPCPGQDTHLRMCRKSLRGCVDAVLKLAALERRDSIFDSSDRTCTRRRSNGFESI